MKATGLDQAICNHQREVYVKQVQKSLVLQRDLKHPWEEPASIFFFLLCISTLRHSELSNKQWLLSDSLNCPTTVQRRTRNSECFLMKYIVKTASGGILPFTLVQFRFFNYLFLNTTTVFFTSGFWMFLHVCLWLLKGNDSLGDCGQKSWYWNVKFSSLAVSLT